MTPLLRRPILVGGLGLTAGAWLLNGLDSTIADLSGTVVWGAIALGSGLWWLKQQGKPAQPNRPATLDRSGVEKALAIVETRIEQLAAELPNTEAETIAHLRQRLVDLKTAFDRQSLSLGVIGGQAVGKTTLVQWLKSTLPAVEIQDGTTADLTLYMIAGDLTDSDYQALQQLQANHHPLVLLFNKQDQYLPTDRPVIVQQLRDRLHDQLPSENILAISAHPAPIKVRQQQADGSVQERIEQPAPDLVLLQERLSEILTQQGRSLVLAAVWRQTQALNQTVQTELNQYRRARALPVIEQYQWIAAAAAFANPVPSLDLLATATVNAQMVVDLGAIYQQTFSLDQAKTVMGNLATQMVKLGLVEMASQAIAPVLKSHALTYVAGGTLQGMSAAYLTRLAGLSLVEYFEEQSQSLAGAAAPLQIDRLVQKLKAVLQANQRSAFVQTFVKQGLDRLLPRQAQGQAQAVGAIDTIGA